LPVGQGPCPSVLRLRSRSAARLASLSLPSISGLAEGCSSRVSYNDHIIAVDDFIATGIAEALFDLVRLLADELLDLLAGITGQPDGDGFSSLRNHLNHGAPFKCLADFCDPYRQKAGALS